MNYMWAYKPHAKNKIRSVGGYDNVSRNTTRIQHEFTDFTTRYNKTRKFSQHALQHKQTTPYLELKNGTTK